MIKHWERDCFVALRKEKDLTTILCIVVSLAMAGIMRRRLCHARWAHDAPSGSAPPCTSLEVHFGIIILY